MPNEILILDDDPPVLGDLARAFRDAGDGDFRVHHDARTGVPAARLAACDLLVFDADLGDGPRDGLHFLRELREAHPALPVVVTARAGSVELAAEIVAAGANDLLVRGERLAERVATQVGKIRPLVRTLRANDALREAESARHAIVGKSAPLRRMLEQISKVGPVPRPVLVLGERGSGKELVAEALHRESGRRGAFVAVNCACFSDELLEAELFGHERGAFTGASKSARGKFELADHGTLFLDEIGHMSAAFQRKILRAVEYGAFLRVGGQREQRVDVRIVAATNADLEARVAEGTFLPDLYDRMAFEVIRVPALRDRPGDIEILARHFFLRFMNEVPAFHGKTLSQDALDVLRHYDFPGNVRELRTIIERAVYRDTTAELTAEDIGELGRASSRAAGTFHEQLEALERRLVHEAMDAASGNGAEAARGLGLAYHQLRYYLKKHPWG